jgi:hypothetical protein
MRRLQEFLGRRECLRVKSQRANETPHRGADRLIVIDNGDDAAVLQLGRPL